MIIALLTSCEESDKYTVVVDTDDLICYVEYTSDYQISTSVGAFDANITAHEWHNGIGRIYFDKPIKKIGNYAFYKCYRLTSINIPDSVTSIGDYAFCYCYSLTSINIPDSVTSIGGSAFSDCSRLTSIDIPDSVTYIWSSAFCYCSRLTSVYCRATTPPQLGSFVFAFNATGRKIYVPRNSVDAYKSAAGWSNYAAYIVGYDFE